MLELFRRKTLGGILLVAGTAIGAGMLALPVITSELGFYYAIAIIFACYGFMLISLYLLMEANFYSKIPDANLITMTREHLGVIGQGIAWLCSFLLLYAVAAAYISAGGALIGQFMQIYLSDIPVTAGMFVFIVAFGFIVVFGTRSIDLVNRFLVAGLVLAYLYLVTNMVPEINTDHFIVGDIEYLWAVIPIVILSFTSHIILPSLKSYLDNDAKNLSRVLFIGSLIPLIFYLIWQAVIMGVLPVHGPSGLIAIEHSEHPLNNLITTLKNSLGITRIASAVTLFSFFALVTSFLAVTLSLVDFLADGFQIKKTTRGRFFLALIALAPPLLFALFFPKGFILALGYAGIFVAILYGILPMLMVWKSRYQQKMTGPTRVWGGKPLLVFMLLGSIAIIIFQIGTVLKIFPL